MTAITLSSPQSTFTWSHFQNPKRSRF